MNLNIRPLTWILCLAGFSVLSTLCGCGTSEATANGKPITAVPLTDEQKAAIRANDQAVEDQERGENYQVGKSKRRK